MAIKCRGVGILECATEGEEGESKVGGGGAEDDDDWEREPLVDTATAICHHAAESTGDAIIIVIISIRCVGRGRRR